MKKRMLSLVLALGLAIGLGAPGFALEIKEEEPADMDGALAAVTALVKEALDVDDEYTDFSGSYNDGLQPGWSLNWSDGNRELSVSCTTEAVVTDVYFWQSEDGDSLFYGFDPAFPALGEEDARTRAREWLDRLMGTGESARIDGFDVSLDADAAYRFTGRVLKNGLESPVTFRLRLDENGLLSYNRSDSYAGYVGALPGPLPTAARETAAEALAGAVETELYYVSDGEGGARLRYVPAGAYTVVDAQSGETVDMDALYASFNAEPGNGAETPAAAEAAYDMAAGDGGGRALTQVEISSIDNYKDAMSQEALDSALRAVGELGLGAFTLERCSYAMESGGEISASLRYSAAMTEDNLFGFSRSSYEDYISWADTATVHKYITVNAKTGAIVSVSTSYPVYETKDKPGRTAEKTAGAFLEAAAPEMYGESGLCTLSDYGDGDGLTYSRMHAGYFYPENYLYVEVNEAEKTVDAFRYEWEEDIDFAPAEGIVSQTAAEAAYVDALTLTLGYVAWPEDINYDDPVYAAYADWGYTYVESLRLAYYYGGADAVSGVDALTGEAVAADGAEEVGYVYDDLDGEPRREMIEALGKAGVGFSGGRFRPGETLTRREALTLLLQAAGYAAVDWEDDQLESQGVYLGLIAAGDFRPEADVSRMDFLRMLLGASQYGPAAALTGIWSGGFEDVSGADAGYAAIARALGMAGGDSFAPDSPCTRADAAELLYRFMDRGREEEQAVR